MAGTSLVVKASAYNVGDPGLIPGLGRSPGEGNGKPTPVFLPREFNEQRSLEGYSAIKSWTQLSTKELMLLNCGVGEDSGESLGLQGDPTSPF